MMERSRRQVLVEIAATVGAVLVGASFLDRLWPGRKRSGAPGRFARGGTPAAPARRVKPAPFTVKRNG